MSDFTRRELFRRGGMIAVGMMSPPWLAAIAKADLVRQARGQKPASDTVLVVCQFSGGNDGLNTVVPYSSAEYYKLRPTLAIQDAAVLKLNDPPTFTEPFGPNTMPDGFIRNKFALPKSVV